MRTLIVISQYFRCYSPVAFGKKTDPDGLYIKQYLPQLAKYPAKYIYEPWKAPLSIQQAAGCIIGKDYPLPIVQHETISKVNMQRMKDAYANQDQLRVSLLEQDGINKHNSGDNNSNDINIGKKASSRALEVEEIDQDEDHNDTEQSNQNKKNSTNILKPKTKKRLITDFINNSESSNDNHNHKRIKK